MPQKPTALGALKKRTYTPRPVQTPQTGADVDALLADSRAFLDDMPEGTGSDENQTRLAGLLADMDAGDIRQAGLQASKPEGFRLGAAGAVAKSAATPIRVLSQFGGPATGFIGEGIAQGLDAAAMLDGAPVPQGSTAGDITKSLGKAATATAFGKLNTVAGPLSALTQRTGRSLAARMGIGAAAGAAEGVGLNVAQGALTRGFDEGSLDAAFDKDGMLLDATLGGGLGAAGGAALGALGARTGNVRPARTAAQGPTSPWPQQPAQAPWQAGDEAAWARNQATPGNVRGPAPRQRVPPPGLTGYGDTPPVGPSSMRQIPGPGGTSGQFQLPAIPPGPEVGTQAVTPSVQGSPRFDVLDPANTYAGPADPTAMPPGVPEPSYLDYPPTAEEIAALGAADPVAPTFPAPTGPEVPQGRFPAGDPTAEAATPFQMPERPFPAIDEARRIAALETPPSAEELQMFAVREMGDPSADVSLQTPPAGPATTNPFDVPVSTVRVDAGLRQTFGAPERMTSDGRTVSIYFAGKTTPFNVPLEALGNVSPELDAVAQRFRQAGVQGDPQLTITPRPGRQVPERPQPTAGPNEADMVALRNERARDGIEDEYGAFEEGDLERMFALESPPPAAAPQPPTYDELDADIEAMLRVADEQDAAVEANTGADSLRNEPEVEVVDPDTETLRNNASGDSSASVEAMNRQSAMRAKGESFVMLDRAGRETPLIGTDAVDQVPGRGQTKAIKKADGSYEVVQDNGGRVPTNQSANPEVEPARINGAEPDPVDEVFDLGDPTPAPSAAPEAPAAAPVADTALALNDGDQPGTMNQAGKFVPIADDSWRTLDVPKNKSVVIRRADGTVTMVRDNGGKVPKKWDAEKWGVKQEQQRAKDAARVAREEAAAAKKAAKAKPAAEPQGEYEAPMTADEASGDAQAPAAADAPSTEALEPPPQVRSIEKTKFGDRDAVEMAFETRPSETIRKALSAYGFRYFARDRKWAFNIPKGSKITPDEVESAVQAILRGEDVDSVQKAINLDAGQQKAAANAVQEGRWAPEPDATVLRDRDLSPDAAERETRRTQLRQLGWTPGVEGNRRIWTKPADGMRGDLELRGSAPEVPPANPPQAGEPSAPSASAATPNSTMRSADATSSSSASTTETMPPTTSPSDTPTGSAAGPSDYTKVDPLDVKVDPKAYQFKTGGDARGRNDKLKGVEEWDPMQGKLSPVLLHRRLDGSTFVVDGHQRVGIAQDLKRAGKDVPDLNAIVLDEADGVTVEQARRAGAMTNVMHNTADPVDIARVLREGDLTPLEQKRIGRLAAEAGDKFKIGRDLAKLDDAAFNYMLTSQVEPRFARLVAQYRPELQEPLLQQLDRANPRTYSEAESIVSLAAEKKSGGVQRDMFGNLTVDDSFDELVKFRERVLSTFRTNRRLFGKAGNAADRLETAGSTKIDRDAAGKVATAAGRAEELWSKFANAQGSYTRQAVQEAFDDVRANRISFGKATDRIAEALDADFTGRPPGGADGGGAGARPMGDVPEGDAPESGPGGLFNPGAVAEGSDGAIEDAADSLLDAAKRFLKDEKGSVNLGDGLAGVESLLKRNPQAFYTALRAGGGAFLGALTHDDEDASILDNLLLGAALGAASPRFSGAGWRALKKAAPIVHREVREALTGRVYGRGPISPRAVPRGRAVPDATKDISGFAKVFWSPDKVVPDVWNHIEPIMRTLYELDAPSKGLSPDQLALSRRAQVGEAMSYMRGSVTRAKNDGHTRRAAYIEALMDELAGRPTVPEAFLSDMTNGKVKPKDVRRVMSASTNAIYHTLLGWNVASGLANMTQAALNYPLLGAKATAKGILTAYSKAGRQELSFLNLNRRPMGHDEERLFHRWIEKYLEVSQTPMRWSDSGNRRATYAGAMEYATSRGFSKADATTFANELVGQTQGIAGDLGNNPFHRHLGPLRVFTKYPLIWGSMMQDFATHPDPAVKRRFLGMMTGIFAASALSGIQLANFFIPRAGMVPGVGAVLDLGQHLFGSPDHDFEEHAEIGGTEDKVTPGYLNKLVSAGDRFSAKGLDDRNIIGRKGQVLRSVSAAEDLGSLLGVETTNRSAARKEESAMYEFATDAKRDESVRSRRIRREAGERLEAGDRAGANRALRALSQRQRNEFKKERLRTAQERARRLVPLRRRKEFDEQFPGEK